MCENEWWGPDVRGVRHDQHAHVEAVRQETDVQRLRSEEVALDALRSLQLCSGPFRAAHARHV